MQAAITYIRKELKDHYSPAETEGLIRFLFATWKDLSTTDLLLKSGDRLGSDDRSFIVKVVERLKNHEPIQYILGKTEFFGLPFQVNPHVLIPRPETEELVDWILKTTTTDNPVILDVGTGSGCIAVSLQKNLPGADVCGCDISEDALQVARANAVLNGVRIPFFNLDVMNPSTPLPFFDLIVSNPPYVTEQEKQLMQQNVLHYEPHQALFVPDQDPLKFYRALVSFSSTHLKAGGRQFWEINERYGKECFNLMEHNGYENIQLRKDVNGKDRMISGTYAATCSH